MLSWRARSDTAPAGPSTSSPFGIKVLHDPPSSVTDIVFVHGLTGDRERTWRAKDAVDCWPKAILPAAVPQARIMTFGYDAYVANWVDWQGKVSKNRIRDHAGNLLHAIAAHRIDGDERSIIFICHSLGGLVCKDALVVARERKREAQFQNILQRTQGIVFMGTPHQGSALASWFVGLARIVGLVKSTNSKVLRDLKHGSDELNRIQESFHNMLTCREVDGLQPIDVVCCFEELSVPGVGQVVGCQSATLPGSSLPIGIHRNHREMTKLPSEQDPAFKAITAVLRRWVNRSSVAQETEPGFSLPFRPNRRDSDTQPGLSGFPEDLDMSPTPTSSSAGSTGTDRSTSTTSTSGFVKIPSGERFIVSNTIIDLPFYFPSKSIVAPRKYFQPRKAEVDEIKAALLPRSADATLSPPVPPPAPVSLRSFVVTGLGGCGKTELIYRFVAENKGEYDAIFVLTADSASRLSEQYTKLATRLGLVDEKDRTSQDLCREVLKTWLADPVKGAPHAEQGESSVVATKLLNWLLVFDNAEDVDDLWDFWPDSGHGSVLVTSRNPIFRYSDAVPGLTGSLALGGLPDQDAASLLQHLAKQGQSDNQRNNEAAMTLAKKMCGLPLAINQIGSILWRQRMSLSRFVEIYAKQSDFYDLFPQRHAHQGYRHSLATVWALDTLPDGAFAILCLVSMLDPVSMDDALLRPNLAAGPSIDGYPEDENHYRHHLSDLSDCSIIDVDAEDGHVSVHRLVQDVARAQMEGRGLLSKTFNEAIRRIGEHWPFLNRKYVTGSAGNVDRWKRCEDMMPHVLYVKEVHNELLERKVDGLMSLGLAELLLEAAQFRMECGLAHKVAPLLDAAEAIYNSDPDTGEDEQVKLYRGRVGLAMHLRDAENLLCYALLGLNLEERRHEKMGHPTSTLAIAYNDLAMAYALSRQWDQSIVQLKRSKQTREALPDFSKDKLFSPQYHLGLVLHHMGKHSEAAAVLDEAIKDRAEALGPKGNNSLRTAALYYALGNVKYAQKDFDRSFDLHQQAVDTATSSVGPTRVSTLGCMYQLARHYARRQEWEKAYEYIGQILAYHIDMPPYYHAIARVTYLHSQVCRKLSKADEAMESLQKTVHMHNSLRPEHLRTVSTLTEEDVAELIVYDCI